MFNCGFQVSGMHLPPWIVEETCKMHSKTLNESRDVSGAFKHCG